MNTCPGSFVSPGLSLVGVLKGLRPLHNLGKRV